MKPPEAQRRRLGGLADPAHVGGEALRDALLAEGEPDGALERARLERLDETPPPLIVVALDHREATALRGERVGLAHEDLHLLDRVEGVVVALPVA